KSVAYFKCVAMPEMKNILRIMRIKKWIEVLAYGSLALDYMVTIATLIAVNHYWNKISVFLFYFDEALTAEVILVTVLLVALFFLHHYEKIVDRFAMIRKEARMKRQIRKQKQ
ncbi:MAG: hypothetical protein QW549_02750, partial [Candidatus Micrarchaeaceae archaeon]